MIERQLAETGENWRGKVAELQALLAEIRPKLIEAEAQLADRFAAINAFEFKLRARIEPLVHRLEAMRQEISALRQQLRQMQEDWFFAHENGAEADFVMAGWKFDAESGAAAGGDYRYMGPEVKSPPENLSADKLAAIKKLYRQLARRFHPDLAVNAADRAYRTDMMMRINVAYTAGDLEKLQALAAEPDSAQLDDLLTDQQLAAALLRELTRCRARMAEIEAEFASLAEHRNARLLLRAERAAAAGRDLLAEIAVELQEEIGQCMVERDVLQQEIETFSMEQEEVAPDTFADTIYDLNLEQLFDEEDESSVLEDWHRKRRDRFTYDEDILDDLQ